MASVFYNLFYPFSRGLLKVCGAGLSAVRLLCFILFGVCLSRLAYSDDFAEKEPLTWIKWDQAPVFVPDGTEQEQRNGIFERIINYIHQQPEMSDFRPRALFVNHARFNEVARYQENCYVGWETFAEHRVASSPLSIARPWVLWTLKRKAGLFGQAGQPISLAKVLEHGRYRIGGIKKFTYSEKVRSLIERYAGQPNVFLTPALTIEVKPQLLDLGRVDAFLGNPGQMQYLKGQRSDKDKYVSFNLVEEPNYTPMVVSCSRTPKGHRIVSIVNSILTQRGEVFLSKVLSFHDRWEGEVTPEFKEVFMTYLVQRQSHPLVLEKAR